MRGFPIVLLFSSCLACAAQGTDVRKDLPSSTGLPAYLADPDHVPPPSCPARDFRWAIGQSSQGREAALLLAKKNLLSQINSVIHIQAEDFSRQISVNGKDVSEFREVVRVLGKIDFAHGDLIQVAEAPAKFGAQTYMAVCLPRASAIARLEGDLAPEVQRFDVWHRSAEGALQRRERPAFVAALNNLSAAMTAAGPILVEIRALGDGPSPTEQHLTSRWLSMIAAKESLRSQIRFVLNLRTDDRLQPASARLSEIFRSALVSLGNEVRLDASCPAGSDATAPAASRSATYLIQVQAKAACERTSLGITCRPGFEVRGNECSSRRQIFVTGLQRLSTAVTDPGGEERAMRRLIQRLETATVNDDLRAALKSELPVDEDKRP